jgi:hypothetical protein
LARVDRAGRVGPTGAGWSLDWWVGAEDRWYLPARETAVRQSLVEDSPVVETRQRVPGGDIVHRVHAAVGTGVLGGREAVVVELTNATPVPVAVALAVSPDDLGEGGSVHRLVPHDRRRIGVDGAWTLLLDRDARKAATGDGRTDLEAVVTSGGAAEGWEPVDDRRGRASLALVFPLPHTASLRVALVAGSTPTDGDVEALPGADAVASGWARQADRGLRVVLPDDRLAAAFTAARRRLLLEAPDLAHRAVGTDQALVGRALIELGYQDELRATVADLLERQRLTGAIPDDRSGEAATGAALALLGWWWSHDPRPELLGDLVGPVAAAAHRIDRRRTGRRFRRAPTDLLPAGPQPAELGGPMRAYLDDWWSVAGLEEAAAMLGAAGQDDAAVDAERTARALQRAVDHSVSSPPPGGGSAAIPAGPDRDVDEAVVAVLPALAPLGVVDGADPLVLGTVDLIRSQLVDRDGGVRSGVAGPTISPWLTACLVLHELDRGEEQGLGRLDGLVRAGGDVASWPTRLDERGGGHDRGDDPVATALFVAAVRALLCRERRAPGALRADGLDILPVMPPTWLGAGVEMHDAPTTFGRFGFALRWHGERPALLWELEPAPGAPAPTLTAPGLAPGWSTTEPVGEALLAAPAMAGD